MSIENFNFTVIYRAIKLMEKKGTARRMEYDFLDYKISIYRCSDSIIRADFKNKKKFLDNKS